MSRTYYVTTSIPYASGPPHIGNAIDWLYADVVSRYQSQQGRKVVYSAGADEHGSKIYEKAVQAKLQPAEFIEAVVPLIKQAHSLIGSEFSHFARTDSAQHRAAATLLWQKMGDEIYKSTYEGWYCVGCEEFKTDTEVAETRHVCPLHQKAYEKVKEDNYFFRLGNYQDRLRQLIESDELLILPQSRKNEALGLLKNELRDISISRPATKLPWGVPVPNDKSQVMYVWFEALMNYVSLLDFPDGEEFKDYWPTDLQIVGKDNLRFHALIYPAMLLSAQLPLLKNLFVHGHITVDGQKMSKTVGNVVTAEQIVGVYGSDAFRYFFLRHVSSYEDGDFTWERFDRAYHNELGNDLGNTVQRIASMINRYQQGVIGDYPKPGHDTAPFHEAMAQCQFDRALAWAWELIKSLSVFIEQEKPWQLAKEADESHLREVLAACVGDILQIAELLRPFLPQSSEIISRIFEGGYVRNYSGVLFPKIEADQAAQPILKSTLNK